MTKILEVMIAIIFTFTFLAVLLPQVREMNEQQIQPIVSIDTLLRDQAFRTCLVENDRPCVTQQIEWILPPQYDFRYQFFSDEPRGVQLPETADIDATSSFMFIANASSSYGFTSYTFILYYWQ